MRTKKLTFTGQSESMLTMHCHSVCVCVCGGVCGDGKHAQPTLYCKRHSVCLFVCFLGVGRNVVIVFYAVGTT